MDSLVLLIFVMFAVIAGVIAGLFIVLLIKGISLCRKRLLANKRACDDCIKQHTMKCPNAALCQALKDKPYWESRF